MSENKLVVPLMNRIDVKRIVVLILLMQAALVSFAQMSDEQVVSMLKEARDQGKSQEEMIVLCNTLLAAYRLAKLFLFA